MDQQGDNMPLKKDGDSKRVHFYADKDAHIRFRTSLEKHNMTMSEFLRACCDAVSEDDSLMLAFLDEYKDKSKKHSKNKNKILKKDLKKSENLLADLGIDEDDIEGLFDFIAEQHPEI
jgi:3-deoxy-D-arabino-heptulosonate 7-phosphate (DAHP) synthase